MTSIAAAPKILLNPYLSEDVRSRYSKYSRIATAYWCLDKITLIAIGAIMAAIFAVTYGGAVLSGGASIAALIAIVATYPLTNLAAFAHSKSKHYGTLASLEEKVIARMALDLYPDEEAIVQFLTQEGVSPEPIRSQIPLTSLRPLIARYEVIKEEAAKLHESVQKEMVYQGNNRYATREHGFEELERGAIPAAINGAILLQIIQNPTLQFQINYPNSDFTFPKIGLCRPKPPLHRILDRNLEPRDDKYFFFLKSLRRAPLTLGELSADPSPKVIRSKLFPGLFRARA